MERETLGRYRLLRRLATGGMAEVFLAVAHGPEGFRKVVVVKRVLPHFSEDPRFVEMFLDEARLAARLEHPNIVQIFDMGESGGRYFLAMEYLRGLPVSQLLRRLRMKGQNLPHPLAAQVVLRAAQALHHAHRLTGPDGRSLGIVHRDISPDNLFVTREGVVKVLDFGIARAVTNRHETAAGTVKGKFAYMSPEQVRGLPLDPRSDVFSLGVVLYELTTSSRPFGGASDLMTVSSILNDPPPRPAEVFPGYEPQMEAVCLKCLEKDPDRRWASAGELAAALSPLAGPTGAEAALSALVTSLATEDERACWDHPVEESEGEGATVLVDGGSGTLPQGTPDAGRPEDPGMVPKVRTGGSKMPPAGASEEAEPGGRTLAAPSRVVETTASRRSASPAPRGRKGRSAGVFLVVTVVTAGAAAGGFWVWQSLLQDKGEGASTTEAVPVPSSAGEPAVAATPTPTRIVVRSVPTATVEVDGIPCGVGRCERELSPGQHRVRVRGTGFEREEVVELPPERTTEVEAMPPPGTLHLKLPPGFQVWLDGEPLGKAPFVRPIRTWQGVHSLRLLPPRGEPVVRSVVLTSTRPEVTVSWP